MQFHTDGKIFKVVCITGPTHNYLGLSFVEEGNGTAINIEPLVMSPKEPKRLDADSVSKWVMVGLQQVNQELTTQYRLENIQFVVSDSPPAEVYANLTRCIVERMHTNPDAFNGTTG